MITKHIVKNDKIYLYENDELIMTLPNDENNIEIIKLLNDQVFINDDINNAKVISDYYHDSAKRYAIYSLMVFVVLGVVSIFNISMITSISTLLLGVNIIAFIISNDKLKKSNRRLSHLEKIKSKIEERIEELQNNLSNNKIDNQVKTYTNEQITRDHQKWLEDSNEIYDYQSDVELIKNSKIYIKK